MNAPKYILQYSKDMVDYKIAYNNLDMKKKYYVRLVHHGTALQKRNPLSGILLYWNGDPIHWRSKKQGMVALSSPESELETMSEI